MTPISDPKDLSLITGKKMEHRLTGIFGRGRTSLALLFQTLDTEDVPTFYRGRLVTTK